MKNLAFCTSWSNTRSIEELTKKLFPLWERTIIQERYILFSLSLPYKFHKSIFPYRGRWTGNRGLILTLARKSPSSGRWWKERRVIPVSDLMGKGKNLRFPFFDLSTIETVPAIVRYLADEYSTVARRIKFSKRTKSVPRGLVQENPVLTMFSNGGYTSYVIWSTARNETRSIMKRYLDEIFDVL